MNNKYPSRLAYLMDKFTVTAKELSEALHVDHSLVSKWRNNKRNLSPRSIHLENIVNFFLTLDSNLKFNILSDIMQEHYPNFNNETKAIKAALLKKWLLGSPQKVNRDNLLNSLNKRGSYTAHFDVLKGNKGRRQASVRLMNLALSLPPPQELLLYSQSSQENWYSEDKMFSTTWKNNYLEILRRGNYISLVHSLDHQISSVINMLIEWLPMELTGKLKSYYFLKYSNKPLKPSVLVIKGHAAILSVSNYNSSEPSFTHFFTDPITVQQAQAIFYTLLSDCRLIYEKYTKEQDVELFERLLSAEKQPENSFYYTSLPIPITFPASLLQNFLDGDNLAKIRAYRIQQQHFFRNLQNNYCRLILNYNLLENPFPENGLLCEGLSIYTGEQARLNQSLFCTYLQHLLELINKYPNLEIAFAQDPPIKDLDDVSILVKQNTAFLISTQPGENENSLTLFSHEPSIINAYYLHFENYWSTIPRIQRDKTWVITNLQKLLTKLSNYI